MNKCIIILLVFSHLRVLFAAASPTDSEPESPVVTLSSKVMSEEYRKLEMEINVHTKKEVTQIEGETRHSQMHIE